MFANIYHSITDNMMQSIYAIQIFYYLSVFCIKMSIMCLYLRICKFPQLLEMSLVRVADTFYHSARSTHMVLESKYCHDSSTGYTIHIYNPCYSLAMSADTKVLELGPTRDLHRYKCVFLL